MYPQGQTTMGLKAIDNRSVYPIRSDSFIFDIHEKSYEWEKGTYKITSVTKRTKGQKNDHEDRC